MIKNYFKIALRNAWRNKSYTLINVFGLSAGIVVCLIIWMWIRHETGYDRFHEHADRIFRVVSTQTAQDRSETHASVPIPFAESLEHMENVQRVILGSPSELRVIKDELISKDRGTVASQNIFDVFSFELLHGNPQSALREPFTVVITETMALKYFASKNPIGESLTIEDHDYIVTGILATIPSNSHVRFDFLTSSESQKAIYGEHFFTLWFGGNNVYLKLDNDVTPEMAEAEMRTLLHQIRPENINPVYEFSLLPLTDIYLHSDGISGIPVRGELRSVYLYSTIAIFILLIAVINYMNLATAKTSSRTREVGIRKVIGAKRSQLVRQFMGESVFFTGIAFLLAFFVLELLIPLLSEAMEIDAANLYWFGVQDYLFFTGMIIGVGILAGSYPSFFLSSPGPAAILKNQNNRGDQRHSVLRKALVVSQFTCSIALIFATSVVYKQMDFVENMDLGFDEEHIVTMPMSAMAMVTEQPFKAVLLENPRILNASFSFARPGIWIPETQLMGVDGEPDMSPVRMKWIGVDYDFLETFRIGLLTGRNFSDEFSTDETEAFLINETAARFLGFENPVGLSLELELNNRKGTIIGVVRDFHYTSLRQTIEPMIMYIDPVGASNFSVRISPGDISETLSFIRDTWQEFYPDRPFEYTFLDEEIMQHYRAEERFGMITAGFSILAIIIACLGLFGLVAYAVAARTKEIGIRKVMGASITNIIALINKDFLKLVFIGFVIAIPIAWYAMNRWLEDFAYRIDLGPGIFALAGGAAVLIALATVSWQSVRAALANPVHSLRSE